MKATTMAMMRKRIIVMIFKNTKAVSIDLIL